MYSMRAFVSDTVTEHVILYSYVKSSCILGMLSGTWQYFLYFFSGGWDRGFKYTLFHNAYTFVCLWSKQAIKRAERCPEVFLYTFIPNYL